MNRLALAPTFATALAARQRIQPFCVRLPLVRLNCASTRPIYLKLENLQPVGSFKIRCGANALLSLSGEQRAAGVVTASAGNFAQGLACAARALEVPVTAIVPDTAARSKLEALRAYGVQIREEPYARWWQLLEEPPAQIDGRAFIHPVSDREVLAGNATLALEILEDLAAAPTVLVPYGGGGLSVGIAAVLKEQRPASRVYACETEAGAPVAAAFAAGHPVEVAFNPNTFVTGMGSRRVLDSMWPLVQRLLDGAVSATLADTAGAIHRLMRLHHVIAEGAGAAPVAAALAGVPGEGPVVCVVSGGHLDPKHIIAILSEPGHVPSA